MPKLPHRNSRWIQIGLLSVVACLYFFRLTRLPVFADEAIYIRWAQLIIDDMGRYAFFPLNDGKTPLFMWLLVPFQFLPFDHLFAGRTVSVVSAVLLAWISGLISRELGGTKRVVLLTQLCMAILPFWFFSARLALIDTTLVLFLALMVWSVLRYHHTHKWLYLLTGGVSFGLALWTKIPAILGVSLLCLTYIPLAQQPTKHLRSQLRQLLIGQLLVGCIGLAIFGVLKLNPAFGQLFSRGGDFLLAADQRTAADLVKNTVRNAKDFALVFTNYLTLSGLVLALTAVFLPRYRRTILLLLLAAVGYCLPIMVLGKVVYPRYLLPAAFPLTLAIVFAIENYFYAVTSTSRMIKKTVLGLVVALLLAHMASFSSAFMLYAWLNPNRLPLTKSDREQYLSEWSAGNGIYETVKLMNAYSQNQRLLVLTEGYFGTLPDGILLYLHRSSVTNLFVEGIGQPVTSIPAKQQELMPQYNQVWLVVNSHRNKLHLPPTQKIAEFCRLADDPCLEVWDITSLQSN